jgi:hypothetical protein
VRAAEHSVTSEREVLATARSGLEKAWEGVQVAQQAVESERARLKEGRARVRSRGEEAERKLRDAHSARDAIAMEQSALEVSLAFVTTVLLRL